VPIHFVDLTAVATVELMPSYVGAVLEVAQDPNLSPAPQIATALGRRRAILVLDNCEHLMPEVARFVASILEADPNARILATSRIPLAVGGERLFDLDPLAVDPDGTSPAIQLFADRAADVAPEFVLDEVTLPHVRAIVTALDGLPLAIELAASMLRILPVSELAAVLPNRLDLLEGGDARPDRHRSLAAALRWNVESLDQATRDAFVTLGVMTGPFSIDDVAGVVGVGMRDAIRIATALTDHSLLKRTVADGRTVLRMLETIRWFALESLGDTEQAARDRHLDVFRKVAIEARRSLRTSEAPNALARLWPRRSNVLTAFEYALQVGRLDSAIELIEGLVDAWAIRATGREARIATTKLIESVDSAPPELQLRALFARLEVWQNQGVGIAPERPLAERAHALAKEVGDAASKVRTRIWMMGAGVIRAGDPKKLVAELIAAGDERALGYGMDGVGWLLWWADRREEAIDVFRTSYERAVEHGDPVGRLDAAAGMIATSQTEAEVAVAASLIDELAGVVEALGCRWWEGFRLQWAASHSRSLGHLDESLEWLSRAYEVVCERGTINQIAFIASHQAAVAWDAGKVDLAYAKTVEFANANRQAAENPHNPFVLEMAAGAAVRWGRAEDAARLCGAAAAWRRPGGLFELGMPMPAWDQERHDKVVTEIETALEGEDFERLMKEGEAMDPDSALTLAMALRRPD
jgi:predicted ATPase